jgi:hypothetical protein
MKITLQAFSSSGGSYSVEITDDNGFLRIFCHCNAGITHQMCKHKAAFIRGDVKMLYDAAQEPVLKQLLSSKAYPALKARFDQFETQLAEVEREIAKIKEKEKAIKKDFVYELTHGKLNPDAPIKRNYDLQPRAST